MNVGRTSNTTLVKRIPTTLDRRRDITTYSIDNLYPQRVEQIMFRSPISVGAVEARADFINGEGFSKNQEIIFHSTLGIGSLTVNDILALISKDYSLYNGFGLHFNYDLTGKISEVTPIDFSYIRYGLPDDLGVYKNVKVNANWERDRNRSLTSQEQIFTFPLFNPENVPEEIAFYGGIENYPGQVMYWTGAPNKYPMSVLDSVLDSAQANGEIQVFELGNIQNGFLGASIFKHQGAFESEAERLKFMRKIQEQQGAENANSIMVIETPDGYEGDILENLPANNNDRLFELTNQNTVRRIMQTFGMPPSILGVMPESGMFNQQDLQDSYQYYNLRTRNDRIKVTRAFNKWGAYWTGGDIEFGEILEQSFTGEIKEPEVVQAP